MLDVSGGFLFVADTGNSSVRRLDLGNNSTTTVLSGLNTPVDVLIDVQTNLFVLTQADGLIRQYDLFDNLTKTNNATVLTSPSAMAFDLNGDIYVVELGGALKKVTLSGGAVSTVVAAGTFSSPMGVEVLDSGSIAVSDTGNHVVRLVDATTTAVTVLTGSIGTAGLVNGDSTISRLNTPHHLAKAAGNVLVVADYGNHAVRKIDGAGTVTLVYGVSSNDWAASFPGWDDGSATVASSREPSGVVVDGDGDVYVTEQFYHLIRKAVGTDFSGPTGVGGGTDSGSTTTINPPDLSFSPNSGYFPLGQSVTVTSPSSLVFYTTDGTDPSTNSTPVLMTNGVGTIKWKTSTNDLSSLRVSSFVVSGTNIASTNVSGVAVITNSVGIPAGLNTNLFGGIGATVLAPVVVNLPVGEKLRTLSFRLEVSANGAAPIVADTFDAVAITTNDFIPVITGDGDVTGPARFSVTPYSFASTRGLSINFIGTNANLSISGFAVVAMLAVPIPSTASEGDSYQIDVILPTGTSDTAGTDLILNSGPSRTLTVTNIGYLVGDSSPAGWYNAGDFGNTTDGTGAGQLLLSDVNNAFNTSVGIRPPYPFTDVFNAMDVFPEDTTGTVGGDGQIRFLDWQIILLRQQHLNTNPVFGISQTNWARTWGVGGVLTTTTTNLNTTRVATGLVLPQPGLVWERQVLLTAGSAEFVQPGALISVPIHARVGAASSLAGLQFRAVVRPSNGALPVSVPVTFNSQLPGERQSSGSVSDVAVAWDLGQLSFAAGSSNLLGHVLFTVPLTTAAGSCYTVDLEASDGSPLPPTQYQFETRAGCVWVATAAAAPNRLVSSEWISSFFGGVGVLSGDNDDADGDGFANVLEYIAGTNPTNANSVLRLDRASQLVGGPVFELLSAPGKRYVLEYRDSAVTGPWTPAVTNFGNGRLIQLPLSNGNNGTRFYRLRVSP